MGKLTGKRIAIITDDGFEESELTSPKKSLESEGAVVEIISKRPGKVRGWKNNDWSIELQVDIDLKDAKSEVYDALVIPGGVINSDQMRRHAAYISFAEEFLEAGKPVGAICHAPQVLIETGMLEGKAMTSFSSIKTDLLNAGVLWEDKEVIVDNGLITSRGPSDLPAFNKKLIEEITEGIHAGTNSFTNSINH